MPQIRAFQVACQENGRTDQEVTDYLFTVHNVSKLADLGRGKEFSDAIRWASAGGKQADPKSQAATAQQGTLALKAAPQPVSMKIGNQTIEWTPDPKKAFAL